MAQTMGRVELICGPMFAGKTTELLHRLTLARDAGWHVVAIHPVGDTRSGAGCLRSHEGSIWPARPIGATAELAAAAAGADVIGIDEAHFFAPDLADVCRLLADAGVCVMAAGVDLDHRGRLFPAIAALQSVASSVTRLSAICARCGAVATYTQRLVAGDAPIVVGGAEAYEPRCLACFVLPGDQ